MEIVWITAQPRDVETGEPVDVRLAGGGRSAPYFREGDHYRAGVVRRPRFSAKLDWQDKGWSGSATPTSGKLSFKPADIILVDGLAGYYWREAPIAVDAGPEGGPFARLLTGTVAAVEGGLSGLSLDIGDLSEAVNKPVVTARFAGTGGIEGGAEAAERVKRRNWGRLFNVELRVLDKANNIHECGDPAFPLQEITALRDMGRVADPAPQVVAWQGSIAATLAALIAIVCVEGSGAVAPSIACVKWWTQPAGPLTCDLKGEIGAGYVETAPEIAERMIAAAGGPAIDNVAAVAALRDGPAGLHIADATETTAAALDRLLLGVSLLWVLLPAGTVVLRPITFDDPVETLVSREAKRVRVLPPIKRRRVAYQRAQRVHNDGEIAAVIAEATDFIRDEPPEPEEALPGVRWYDRDDNFRAYARAPGDGQLAIGDDIIVIGNQSFLVHWTHVDDQPLFDAIANADQALDLLAGFADNGTLDTNEKKKLVQEVARLEDAWPIIDARASALQITTERTAAATKRTAFLAMLAAISPPYTETAVSSPVTRSTYDTARLELDEALQTLAKAISERDSYIADRVVAPTAQIIQYDWTGTASAQLPKLLQFKMYRGNVDVTADSTFTFSVTGGEIETDGLGPGQVSLIKVMGDNGAIACVGLAPNGVKQNGATSISRKQAEPPGSSGGGSGASGFGPVAIDRTITDTSFDGSPQYLWTPSAQMMSDAIGEMDLALNVEYQAGEGSCTATIKLVCSTDDVTFVDIDDAVDTGTVSEAGYSTTPPGELEQPDQWVPGYPGNASISGTFGGFTPSTAYFIRGAAYKTGAPASIGVSGTASGAQP